MVHYVGKSGADKDAHQAGVVVAVEDETPAPAVTLGIFAAGGMSYQKGVKYDGGTQVRGTWHHTDQKLPSELPPTTAAVDDWHDGDPTTVRGDFPTPAQLKYQQLVAAGPQQFESKEWIAAHTDDGLSDEAAMRQAEKDEAEESAPSAAQVKADKAAATAAKKKRDARAAARVAAAGPTGPTGDTGSTGSTGHGHFASIGELSTSTPRPWNP